MGMGLGLHNGATGFKIRHLHINSSYPRQIALRNRSSSVGILWAAVTADNDLLIGLVQGIKGVEKLFLDFFLASDKLHVINDQHVGTTVIASKVGVLFITYSI